MVKKLLFLNIALLCCQLAMVQAQSISPKVIAAAGGTATGGSSIINYNVGEPIIGTLTGGGYQITQGFEQPGGVNSSLLTGLVSYWKLDETSGTTAIDVAGGGNNGTNALSDTLGVTGKIKTAYGFNGTNTSTVMANAPNLNLTTSGTISVWVNLHNTAIDSANATNSFRFIVGKGLNDSVGYNLYYSRYYNRFLGQLSSGNTITYYNFGTPPGGTLVAGRWYHLVVTWGGAYINTYINTVPADSNHINANPSANTYNFGLGFSASTNTAFFDGIIDEVGIWNRKLTAKEDSLLYAAGNGNPYPFDGSGNVLPTANAGGNKTLTATTTSTTLTGNGTGTFITYAWTKVSGGTATIATPTAATTNITGLAIGAYSFQLTVTDNLGNTASSIANITVNPLPKAIITGPNQVLPATAVSTTLNGSTSTGNGITYLWTQTAGANATLASPTLATTNITGLSIGTYTFKLKVTDNIGQKDSSTVNVTVAAAPTSNAGADQNLGYTTNTTFNGSGTGYKINYAWKQTAGASTTITNPALASTIVTGLTTGTYTFQLMVTDSIGQKDSSLLHVTIFSAPTAYAGSDSALSGSTSSRLNGSGTGHGITYLWNLISGPSGSSITAPTMDTTTITGLTTGTFIFQLTVTDSLGAIARDTVKVTVYPVPTANAGTSQTLYTGTTSTTLSGTASGTGIHILWSQTSGTAATITHNDSLKTTITGMSAGVSTFLLTVTDTIGAIATSSVTINTSGGSSLLNGLISYWNLDETSGSTTAFDNAGGGNNGTNTYDTSGVGGKINTSYGLNGTSSKTVMANAPNLNLTSSGTISVWVNLHNSAIHPGVSDNNYVHYIVSKGKNDSVGYELYYASFVNAFTGQLATGNNPTYFNFSNIGTLVAGQWYHLVVTWGNGSVTTYINNTSSGANNINAAPTSNNYNFVLGNAPSSSLGFFDGRIDEVGLWNRALTPSEVASLYGSTLGYPYPFPPQGGTPVGVISAVPSQPLITNEANASVTAYPNPYSTEIHFNMKASVSGKASLILYDLLGRKVATVFEGDLVAGNGKTVSYQPNMGKRQPMIYIFTIGDQVINGKLIPGGY